MFASAILILASICISLSVHAWRVTGCPSSEIYSVTSDGAVWAICSDANDDSVDLMIVNAVKSRDACAQLCDQSAGCRRAAFDEINWLCKLKGNPPTARPFTDAGHDYIQLVSRPKQGALLSFCPNGQYNISSTDASIWAVCPDSNFDGNTSQSITQVTSHEACVQLCRQTPDCTQTVYDGRNLECRLKSRAADWVYNRNYDTIRLLYEYKDNDILSSCPGTETNTTSSKGLGYAICQNSDFAGDAAQVNDQTQSAFDCMLQCDSFSNCTRASYNATRKTCYLKHSNGPWVFAAGMQSIRSMNRSSSYTANQGKWSSAIKLPVVPAAALIVPEQPASHRILAYSSWGPFQFYGSTGMTQYADVNWATATVSHRSVTNTNYNMFCPGMSYLPNGTMAISGGSNANAVSFYDYTTDAWTRAPNMSIARGYQSSTTLSDGRIFTIGGSYSGGVGGQDAPLKVGEVYNHVYHNWSILPGCDVVPMLTTCDAEGVWRTDNHAWLYGWKNETVFQAGPSKTMHWYDTTGTGSVQGAGTRDAQNDTMCGVHVMYDIGEIFSAGGSQSYTNSPAFKRAHHITIGEPFQPATVEVLPEMSFERGFANAVVLPSGQVLITGGQSTSLVFTDVQGVFAPELWNPVTKNFTIMSPAATPRNYHLVSLLLADGSVWSAGGGLCPVAVGVSSAFCDMTIDHFDGEIFSPPYLFNSNGSLARRPKIIGLASDTDSTGREVAVGGTLFIDMDTARHHTFSLVRLGSATHSTNTDQRRVPLNSTQHGLMFVASLPNESGILIPGFWYLFSMDAAGVPCEARTLQIHL